MPKANSKPYDERVAEYAPPGVADLTEDARRLLLEIDRDVPGAANIAADCRPPLDVIETAEAIEVLVDVPGVAADSLRVALRRDTLLVVGAKLAGPIDARARYHLAERSFGRFARVVRLSGVFDAARARGEVSHGRLRIVLPRLEDRRGQVFPVPIEHG
jgi:HSP20 family protein